MQPEPTKYSHAPVLEKQTFVQPEQPLYAHHPGRFVYISDEESGEFFSVPHDPVRKVADEFCFSAGASDVRWKVRHGDIEVEMSVSLPVDEAAELWTIEIYNRSTVTRRLKLFPYFTIGYMSWMNQSASYRSDLGGIVARSVTPYQKLQDYSHIKSLKDLTVLLHDRRPTAWEACRDAFEGDGGIHNPDSVRSGGLRNGDALYETPVAALQYDVALAAGESQRFRFVFGPALDDKSIQALRDRFLRDDGFEVARKEYAAYLESGKGCLTISTPDKDFDNFTNRWLDRQVYYHGKSNRLTTDPQTRNYLQDSMGMVYIDPDVMQSALRRTLSQQKTDGALPEGIVLSNGGTLKYINQIPHTDHCVWLPVSLEAYLDETGNVSILGEIVDGVTDRDSLSVFDRVTNAMRWLIRNRDSRGLSYIAQGDWCDPMNMVGHKGRGVSGWLTIATAHALRLWSGISASAGHEEIAGEMSSAADQFAAAAQEHLWDGDWFARGISDNGDAFGINTEDEGKIYLNPQSWAVMSGIATPRQQAKMIAAIDEHLKTPYGAMMLAPAYTSMRDNIGRVTQKHPGSGENGSIYNHAATFCIYALFGAGLHELAYAELRKMLPGPTDEDYKQRGQLPVFIPNYYRGAVKQFPRTAGRSSQMFNTGAASWLYRTIVERLFGLRGTPEGLSINPSLPTEWRQASATRRFRGATIEVSFTRRQDATTTTMVVDGEEQPDLVLRNIAADRTYIVDITLPGATE
jgi:cellobionic acid phosphorylase